MGGVERLFLHGHTGTPGFPPVTPVAIRDTVAPLSPSTTLRGAVEPA